MRETTKVYVGGSKTTIVGGSIIIKTGGSYTVWAKEIINTAGGQIIQSGKEGGVVYGEYVPPDKVYTAHPKVEKVEFVDEDGKILNQNTKDFYYGQKLKIKVSTSNAKRQMIIVDLQGKSKSKNQKFDILNTRRFSWNGLVTPEEIFETPYFILNPNWYSDDFEKYNYDTHQTEIEETNLNEFFAKIILDAKSVYLPLEGERLKPSTYKRNYEELIGLFKTDDTGEKDLLENYENLYIDKYADENDDIKDIVDDFSEWLCEDNTEASIEEIKAKVSKSAKELWDYVVLQHQDHSMKFTITDKKTGEKKEEIKDRKAVLDDRPLYWARIAMQVILKRQYVFIKDILTLPQEQQDLFFEKSVVPKTSKLAEVIQLFEEKSRNYTEIDFSKANGKKKVLITGFDPFILNQFDNPIKGNIKQSNPSGVIALALANNSDLGAYIQTMVVPVRYTDFDSDQSNNSGQGEGVIEKYISPYIGKVDMIVTISQYLPNENVIDMFGTSRRGGFNDNMDFTRENGTKALLSNDEWIQTTLPKEFEKVQGIKFNWRFNNINHTPNTFPKIDEKLNEGSGGDYLSNEIFYRVAKLRTEIKPNLQTGHFHVEMLQKSGEDLDQIKMKNLINLVTKGLTEAIKTL
ncbi:MAG: hypothetical protein ACK5MD_11110 [Flavobacteriales bacterium]